MELLEVVLGDNAGGGFGKREWFWAETIKWKSLMANR